MLPEHEPDRLEKIIRFCCGAVVGFIACGFFALRADLSNPVILLASAGGGLLCGFLAVLSGNEFWEAVAQLFRR